MNTVQTIFCNNMEYGGVAYTVWELLENFPDPNRSRKLWYIGGDLEMFRDYHRPAFNNLVWRAVLKLPGSQEWQRRLVTKLAIRDIIPGDIAYVWPAYSLDFIRRAKGRGAIAVAERINCMGPTCKAALERAYAHVGRNMPVDLFVQEWLDEERDQMLECDFVTAPNDFVTKSLINAGVQRDRILETSYGWSPTRLAKAMNLVRPQRPPVFAYVGSGIIRKGLNLLLEAWERANINGQLLIAGRIDAEIRSICARQLSRPDVQELGFVRDVANVYAAADIFVFPSHEEGGPQVTYEAAGCGLASIVSPMGAGRMVRDGREGYVIDPFDIDKWADAIRLLAKDRELRQRLADNASLRANEFTWQKVSSRLYDVFEKVTQSEKIDSGPSE
jgi:glycosyltransferase involved in cell wall biosynthesis